MISAMASRSRPARCLTRPTSSESESRAREERSVFMMCLYHAVFRARETAVDARGGAETSPQSSSCAKASNGVLAGRSGHSGGRPAERTILFPQTGQEFFLIIFESHA